MIRWGNQSFESLQPEMKLRHESSGSFKDKLCDNTCGTLVMSGTIINLTGNLDEIAHIKRINTDYTYIYTLFLHVSAKYQRTSDY